MEICPREKEIRRNLSEFPYEFTVEDIERLIFSATHTDDTVVNTTQKRSLGILSGGTVKARKFGYPGLPFFKGLQLVGAGGEPISEPFKGIQFQDPWTLFANRLAIQLGVPSAPSWIADAGFIVCDYFEGSSEGISSICSNSTIDERTAVQIIRSNLLRNLFGQSDTVRENNLYTKHGLLPIDLDGVMLARNFNAASIFEWLGSSLDCNEFEDVFNGVFCANTTKKFSILMEKGFDVMKFMPIIQKEYADLLQKLFLIDENDLAAITSIGAPFKDCSGAIFGGINYERSKARFIETVQLMQVNFFVQAYAQGNLHILLGLPKENEELLKSRFAIDTEKIAELSAISSDRDFYSRYMEYSEKLTAIKDSEGFIDFSQFLSGIKHMGQTSDFTSNRELFSAAGPLVLKSLVRGRTNKSSIHIFNETIGKSNNMELGTGRL